eukprot:6579655-Prymnesium_polylepis.1
MVSCSTHACVDACVAVRPSQIWRLYRVAAACRALFIVPSSRGAHEHSCTLAAFLVCQGPVKMHPRPECLLQQW